MRSLIAVFVIVAATLLPAQAATPPANITGAWIRLLPAKLPAAGYFKLHNDGSAPLQLTGARSVAFGSVMLHQSRIENGRSSMVEVDSVTVPAGGDVEFSPGGYHLMLMQAQQALKVGDRVPVTLIFSGGAKLTTAFTVRPASATGP